MVIGGVKGRKEKPEFGRELRVRRLASPELGKEEGLCSKGQARERSRVVRVSGPAFVDPGLRLPGSSDLSSLSLTVSRTTGEQPSSVPAHLLLGNGIGGAPVERE